MPLVDAIVYTSIVIRRDQETSIMIFGLAWYTLPVFAYGIVKIRKRNECRLVVMGLTIVLGYLLLLGLVLAGDADDRAKMKAFDLNRNGRIDNSERTTAAARVISDQGRDTGRAVAPVLGIPLTVVWYTFLFTVLYGGEWAVRKLSPASPAAPQTLGMPDHRSV
jgi:hypothetical protein